MREHDSGVRWAKIQVSGGPGHCAFSSVRAKMALAVWLGPGAMPNYSRGTIYTSVCAAVLLGVVQDVA